MNTTINHTQVTDTSIKNVTQLAIPLMIQAASGTTMLLVDRLILAQYNEIAMLSVISASSVCAAFSFGFLSLTTISEVFVGQYLGAKHYTKLATPVWQMIWFCLPLAIFFILLGQFAGPFFIQDTYEYHALPYYKICMSCGFLVPLLGALTSFFTAQGKVKIILWNTIFGNALNVVFTTILVFGLLPGSEPLGTLGAAIATVTSQLIQVSILLFIFLNRINRITFNTNDFSFQPKLFWKCIKVGSPIAIGHSLEFYAWTFLIYLLGGISTIHLFIFSIGQTIWIFFAFITEGLSKTVIAIASNLIGANLISKLTHLLASTFTLHSIIMLLTAIPMLIFPSFLLDLFLTTNQNIMNMDVIHEQVRIGLFWAWILLYLDGMVWILAGMLTAGGHTKYIMLINAFTPWFFCILPFYVIVVLHHAPPYATFLVSCIYAVSNVLLFSYRYLHIDWLKSTIHK